MFEYKMPYEIAKKIYSSRPKEDKKKPMQKYLCDYINEQYGLLGTCVKVIYG